MASMVSRLVGQYVSSGIDPLQERLKLISFNEYLLQETECLYTSIHDTSSSILHHIKKTDDKGTCIHELCVYGNMQKSYPMIVQSRTTSKVLKGTDQDIQAILNSMGFVLKKTFSRHGYYYTVTNAILPTRTMVNVRIYQLFEAGNEELPIQPPGSWIVEALLESPSKDELTTVAEPALKRTAKALEDLVELKKIIF